MKNQYQNSSKKQDHRHHYHIRPNTEELEDKETGHQAEETQETQENAGNEEVGTERRQNPQQHLAPLLGSLIKIIMKPQEEESKTPN